MPPQGGDCAAAVLLQLCVLFTRFEVKEPVSLARPPFASLPVYYAAAAAVFASF